MKWHKPSEKKPEQGKKILCMTGGDFYVAQKFGDYWFSVPFYDSRFSRYDAPELWSNIDFPEPYKGYLKIVVEGEYLTIDEIEKKHPDIHKNLVNSQWELFRDKQNERRKNGKN